MYNNLKRDIIEYTEHYLVFILNNYPNMDNVHFSVKRINHTQKNMSCASALCEIFVQHKNIYNEYSDKLIISTGLHFTKNLKAVLAYFTTLVYPRIT